MLQHHSAAIDGPSVVLLLYVLQDQLARKGACLQLADVTVGDACPLGSSITHAAKCDGLGLGHFSGQALLLKVIHHPIAAQCGCIAEVSVPHLAI